MMNRLQTAGKLSGAPHLARRGIVVANARALIAGKRILIADDNAADAKHLATTIGIISGMEALVETVASLRKAVEAMRTSKPVLLFVDDRISGIEKFEHSMPQLRATAYTGPVIVVSSFISPERRRVLFGLGAVDAVHKDDLEGLRVAEAIVRALGTREADPQPDA